MSKPILRFLIFPENGLIFYANCLLRDNLHKKIKAYFLEKKKNKKKKILSICCLLVLCSENDKVSRMKIGQSEF